jgi:hypothetical protein
MSKVWKWIIGILIGLIVVAVVVGAVFMVRNRAFMASSVRPYAFGNGQTRPNLQGTPNPQGTPNAPSAPNGQNGQRMPFGFNGQKGPMMPYGFNNGRHNPMYGWGDRGPMMGGGGFRHYGGFMPFGMFGMGFFLLGGLLHLVIPIGILVLVAYLFYQMGKRAGVNSVTSKAPPAPVETKGRGRKVAKS